MAPRDPVAETAKTGEPDRYLAALYAPEPARSKLIALAAFAVDLKRIGAGVREPLLAEIRLQWWRDALAALVRGETTGHPVADRLGPDIASGLLPAGLLMGMIDAAAERDWPTQTNGQALRSQLTKSESAAFMLAARALGAGHSDRLEAAAQAAGFTYGLARLLAGGRSPRVHQSDLESNRQAAELAAQCRGSMPDAGAAVARLDSALLPAFLPLTMVPVYLGPAEGGAMALRRWWRLLRAVALGRVF